MPKVHLSARRLAGAALGLSLLAALPAAPAGAHGKSTNPEYFVRVKPAAAAGRTITSEVVVTQLVNAHHNYAVIGSLRVTPPAGFLLTGASATQDGTAVPVTIVGGAAIAEDLDLRQAGQKVRFALRTQVRCGTAGASLWATAAHEAQDFEDTSRRTTVRRDKTSLLTTQVRGCSLAFLRQPELAGTGDAVTSVAADPSGASVAVQLKDGNGQPSSQSGVPVSIAIKSGTGATGASLGGTTNAGSDSSGVVSFAPTIDLAGFDYQLVADGGPGVGSDTSDPFDVAGVAVTCTGDCSGSEHKNTTWASIEAPTDGGLLTLSLGVGDVDCNDAVNHFYEATSESILFNVTSGTGRTVVTVRIDAVAVDRHFNQYEVCFSSPESAFTNKYHESIAKGDAGLLHSCHRHHRGNPGVAPAHDDGPIPVNFQPCLEKRWKDDDGNVFVRFSVPPGDPRAKI